MNKKKIGLVVCLFIFSSVNVISVEVDTKENPLNIFDESIWIYANSNRDILKLNNGFLHGRDENSPDINETLIDALNPEEWRLYKINSYILAERHNANITYGLSNYYAWSQGGFPEANPWENWTYYEEYILYNMQVFDYYFPDYPVDYYDIWSEPDHSYYWHGTYVQLLELFYRAYNVIKSYNPDAKVVGPSISWFRPGYPEVKGIIDFLIDLDTIYGIRLDAISWHENGGYTADTKPEDIPYRAQYLRSQIEDNFPPDYKPELHINEYLSGILHLSPGWNVGFLRYLDEANIDKAMRACWYTYSLDPYVYCSDCWYGLNGMFMSDGQTPQRAYWIQYTHSQMEGHINLDVIESNENTNAIAIRNDSSNQIKILVGRYYKNSPNDVSIHITNFPNYQENVYVKIEIVPNDPTFYDKPPQMIPMPDGPILISNDLIKVENNVIIILLENFEDGDAYIITIIPANNSPNPPIVDGPPSGKPDQTLTFVFNAVDPDGDDVRFLIDWDDSNNDTTTYVQSGDDKTASHAWSEKGTYYCTVKAEDEYGAKGGETLFKIVVGKSKAINRSILNFLQKYPNLFPLLQLFLQHLGL